MIRRRFRYQSIPGELSPLVQRWVLRILVTLNGHKNFLRGRTFTDDDLAAALGLSKWLDDEAEIPSHSRVLTELRSKHVHDERQNSPTIPSLQLQRNLARLGVQLGLSEVDSAILTFAVLLHCDSLLESAARLLTPVPTLWLHRILSVLLDHPERAISAALSNNGVLAKSGLIIVNHDSGVGMDGKLELLSRTFADIMFSDDADPVDLLRSVMAPAAQGSLALEDYEHVSSSLDILLPYLRRSVADGRRGVNILLHGIPGTGKSELAKLLARQTGCELFEVSSEDENGNAITGKARLSAFRAAQYLLSQRRALILFDETEDIFNDGNIRYGNPSSAQVRKAWMNRMLEENILPTFWLTNSIHDLDHAFIRRFDMVLELPIPPKAQRQHILRAACSDLLDPDHIRRIADSEALAPAIATRAASVVRTIKNDIGQTETAKAFQLLVNHTLAAQYKPRINLHDANHLPAIYDPGFINADSDLLRVAEGLARSGSGRVCMYGPPGTGKTAYARWLAERLERPLLTRRASDLMSKWVGENEQNIAAAFHRAEQEEAILLIDEVDSFLQERSNARASWETTLVNEMLTQMESFSGIFIASTNLIDTLDQASLRRFDLKIRFDYLGTQQVQDMLHRCCQQLAISYPDGGIPHELKKLKNLTPGDFAAVMRRHRFYPMSSCNELITTLMAESLLKQSGSSPIGFVSY